jgi:hypothetical protein
MGLPNFFIVGAPKAGTDLLYYQLDQHPQIYMSPLKEPNYFASEIRLHNFHPSLRPQIERGASGMRAYLDAEVLAKRFGGIITNMSDYKGLFAPAGSEVAIGEGSVCYLWSRTAATAIADVLPQARIIIVLMDPAERAFHQYLKSLSDGTVAHSFSEHLELGLKDKNEADSEIRLFNPFLGFGEYAEQVKRYLQHFPCDQLSISLYEDIQADYDCWFANILSFLEVDCTFRPCDVDVPSKPHLSEDVPAPQLLPADRARMVEYYRDDILYLQELIRRDLSAWLR